MPPPAPPAPPDPIPPPQSSNPPPGTFSFRLGSKKRQAPTSSEMNAKKKSTPTRGASDAPGLDLSAYPASLRPALQWKQEMDLEWTARVDIAAALDRFVDNALPHRESEKFGALAKEMTSRVKALAAEFLQLGPKRDVVLPAKVVAQTAQATLPPAPRAQHPHTNGKNVNNNSGAQPPQASPATKPAPAATQATGTSAASQAQPSAPPTASWAVVARRGDKKPRHDIASDPTTYRDPAAPASSAGPKTQEGKGKKETDSRLFIRLAQDHSWRKLSPAGARDALAKALDVRPTGIDKVQAVRSGLAITASNQASRATLVKSAKLGKLEPIEARMEECSSWISLMVPAVPISLRTVGGRVEVTENLIKDEVERVTKLRPVKAVPLGKPKENGGPPYRSWTCHFDQVAPTKGFRIFDESGRAFEKKSRPQIAQCDRCLDFHPTRGCSRPPACKNCGSVQHAEEECRALTKCRNCGGPHRSDSRSCLARPFRGGERPAGTQLQMIRQGGQRAYSRALKDHEALLATTQPVAAVAPAVPAVAGNKPDGTATVPHPSPGPADASPPAVAPTVAPTADAVDVNMSS